MHNRHHGNGGQVGQRAAELHRCGRRDHGKACGHHGEPAAEGHNGRHGFGPAGHGGLQPDDKYRSPGKVPAQRVIGAGGAAQLHRQRQILLVVGQQIGGVEQREDHKGAVADNAPPGLQHAGIDDVCARLAVCGHLLGLLALRRGPAAQQGQVQQEDSGEDYGAHIGDQIKAQWDKQGADEGSGERTDARVGIIEGEELGAGGDVLLLESAPGSS